MRHWQGQIGCQITLGFTPESGGDLRQCGEKMRHHLVFGPKVGYAPSRGVQHAQRDFQDGGVSGSVALRTRADDSA